MDQGLIALQRQLHALAPDIALITNGERALERATPDTRPPRLVHADVVEGSALRARRVFGDPVATFAAFLDGTQTSQVLAYIDGVTEVYSVSGEWDLVAIVRVPQYDDIARVITETFPTVPGIQRTQTLTAFRAYSKNDLQQAWDIGVE